MSLEREFPYYLGDSLGEIIEVNEYCPGVFYLAARGEGMLTAREYLVTKADNPVLTDEAKTYGEPFDFAPDVLFYCLDEPDGGRQVAVYEVLRYRKTHGMPPLEYYDAVDDAAFGMENHPEYFGVCPVPFYTTRGKVLRYKVIAPGVFAVETSEFESMVAISYPVWSCELSDYVIAQGELLTYDRLHGTQKTLGYIFFPEQSACLALFELCLDNGSVSSSPYIDVAALMNAVWERYPEYAAAHNIHEQNGDNDVGAKVLRLIGIEKEPEANPENLVYLTPSAGTDYLRF